MFALNIHVQFETMVKRYTSSHFFRLQKTTRNNAYYDYIHIYAYIYIYIYIRGYLYLDKELYFTKPFFENVRARCRTKIQE